MATSNPGVDLCAVGDQAGVRSGQQRSLIPKFLERKMPSFNDVRSEDGLFRCPWERCIYEVATRAIFKYVTRRDQRMSH